MDPDHTQLAIDLGRQMIYYAFLLTLPLLGVGMLVGIMISVLQAATQIQEQTLTFVPKILAVLVALFIGLPWFLQQLLDYTQRLFERMPYLFT